MPAYRSLSGWSVDTWWNTMAKPVWWECRGSEVVEADLVFVVEHEPPDPEERYRAFLDARERAVRNTRTGKGLSAETK